MNTQERKDQYRDDDLQERLLRLVRMMRRHPGGAEGEKHPSRGGMRLIKVVLTEDGISTSQLAERLDIRPSSLTDLVKRMEESGDIRRVQDEQDSRVWRVHATDEAREKYARFQSEHSKQSAHLRICLTDEEYTAFCTVCDKLIVYMEAESPEEGGRGHHHSPRGDHGSDKHHGTGGKPHADKARHRKKGESGGKDTYGKHQGRGKHKNHALKADETARQPPSPAGSAE